MKHSSSKLAALLIYAGILFTAYLNSFPADIMEARNFITAQEMVEYDNWLIPTMNGELRITKPPLPTWITAAVGGVFGFANDSMLRLPASIFGLLLIFALYKLVLKFSEDPDQAFMAGMIASSSFYLWLMSRTGSWDIYCHAFMLVAILFLIRAFRRYFKVPSLLWAGVFMGLSFLSKGPIAFYALLLPFLIAYPIAYGFEDYKRVSWNWIWVLLPAIALSAWWPLYTYLNVPAAATEIASKESSNWLHYNVRPIWHYWSFPVQSGAWTLFFATALAYPFMKKRVKDPAAFRLAFFWTVASVVLLSIVPEKKERYLLPVLIPGAWTMSFYYQILRDKVEQTYRDRNVWLVNKILMLIVAFALPLAVLFLFGLKGIFPLWLCVVSMLCFFAVGIYGARIDFKKSAERIFHLPILLMLFTTLLYLPQLQGVIYSNEQFRSFEEIRDESWFDDLPLYTSHPKLRVEVIWDVRKRILLSEKIAFTEKVGFLSDVPLNEYASGEILRNYQIQELGFFDLNRAKFGDGKTGNDFSQYFTILTPK